MRNIGLFAGSFDPITIGHLDIIERSAQIFEEVIVLISVNSEKKTQFSADERKEIAELATKHLNNVRVDVYKDGLVVDYAHENNVDVLIRGIRNTTDFDYESVIATVNYGQRNTIETIFLLARPEYRYLSSSIVREIAHYKGDISKMLPPQILSVIKLKYNYD